MGYFDNLSPVDFEELTADVLSHTTGLPFRTGAAGPDGGIDLLAKTAEGVHIAQCKHYAASTLSHLRTAAAKEARRLGEIDDLISYRFVTSKGLSHAGRRELGEILAAATAAEVEVLAGSDLRAILRRSPEIEAKNLKLWLTSAGQLHGALNAHAFERSRGLVEELERALPISVETTSYLEARDIIEAEGICIISGAPGTGKTTVGRLLLLDALRQGFQPYELLPESLDDGWRLLALDEKQVFFLDDFLGQTALEGARRRDSDLMRFMNRLKDDPARRLVMTTREYILKEGRQQSEVLEREIDSRLKIVLPLQGYSRYERARIFYNHVYFSAHLSASARAELLDGQRYMWVIDHPAYNPRLIEWMTGWSAAQAEDEQQNFVDHCLAVLDAPERIWAHAFEQGLDDHGRCLLFSLLGLPRQTALANLETAFTAACEARGLELTGRRFHHALDTVDGTFVSTEAQYGSTSEGEALWVRFSNPSVVDFLVDYLTQSPADIELCLRGAAFLEQVEFLWARFDDRNDPASEKRSLVALDCYRRTYEIPPARGHEGTMFDFPDSDPEPRSNRASVLVDRCLRRTEWLQTSTADWLRARGGEWFESVLRKAFVTSEEIAEVARLQEVDGLREPEAGKRLRALLRTTPEDAYRWMSLADLRDQMPGAVADSEWEEEKAEFLEYARRALRYPDHYLGGSAGLRDLCEAGESIGVQLDPDLVLEVEDKIGDPPPYPERTRQVAPIRSRKPRPAKRDEIRALFEKLPSSPHGS